jgi:hypothetical protein
MASFNSWNGDKCHGHRYLLSDVLKDRSASAALSSPTGTASIT